MTQADLSIQGGVAAFCATGIVSVTAAIIPISIVVALFGLLGGARLWISRTTSPPAWMAYAAILADFVLFYAVLLAFHWRPDQDPRLTTDAPTFIFVFVLIALRALRFNLQEMIFAGLIAAIGWTAVSMFAFATAAPMVENFALSKETAILAQRLVAIACLCGVICLAAHRGASYLHQAQVDADRAEEALGREVALNKELARESEAKAEANARLSDINARLTNAEAALKDALARAETATEAKAAFLATTSHELRTPLNAIVGFADAMRSQSHGPLGAAAYVEYLDQIHAAGGNMLKIVTAVLDMAALNADDARARAKDVALEDLVDDAIQAQSSLARRRVVRLSFDPPQPGEAVRVDQTPVRRAVEAVLNNALLVSPEGAEVRVETRVEAEHCLITISDDGPGLDEATLARVFEPFEKGDMSLTTEHAGIGLGLTLARAITEANGGSLNLESTPGEGARAIFRFERARM